MGTNTLLSKGLATFFCQVVRRQTAALLWLKVSWLELEEHVASYNGYRTHHDHTVTMTTLLERGRQPSALLIKEIFNIQINLSSTEKKKRYSSLCQLNIRICSV